MTPSLLPLLLLTLLLKSLLVFALAGLLLLALRRASAAARALVCLLTLIAVLLLPLFSLTLPGWHLPVPVTAQAEPEPTPVRQEPTPPRSSATLPKREGEEFQASRSPQAAALSPRPPASGGPLRSEARTKQGGGFFYLLGLLLASARPLLGLWGIRRLSQTCVDIADTPMLALAAHCAGLLGLRLPRLCRAGVSVPMTWGWRRPVIVLPPASADWPEDRLRSVLLHEMAHVKRRDWPAHRLADFACAVLWFHPFVWLTARRLRSETELACDDLVLASGIPAADYARHLLEIASALPRAHTRSHAVIAMAQTSHIESRLTMILDKTRTRRTFTRRALLAALIPGTAALVTLAVLRPDAKAQTEPHSGAASSTGPSFQSSLVTLWADKSSVRLVSNPGGGIAMTVSPTLSLMTATGITEKGTTLLAGITDSRGPGGKWWSASGKVLPQPVFNSAAAYGHQATTTSPGQRSLLFAFRLPPNAHNVTAALMTTDGISSSSDGTWPGKMQGQPDYTEASLNPATGGVRVVSALYPAAVARGGLKVGLAFGPWKAAASKTLATNATSHTSRSSFIFSPPAETAKGVLLVVSTDATDDLRIVAVNARGQKVLPASVGGQSINKLDQITAQFSLPLSQIKAFRVETRPYQWIEYKDVALKPVQ